MLVAACWKRGSESLRERKLDVRLSRLNTSRGALEDKTEKSDPPVAIGRLCRVVRS